MLLFSLKTSGANKLEAPFLNFNYAHGEMSNDTLKTILKYSACYGPYGI